MLNLSQKGVAGLAVAATVAVVAGASAGTPMAVDSFADQQPDSALYGLEKAGEKMKEATYAGGQDWQLERAEERTQEFRNMAEEKKAQNYENLLNQAGERFQKATQKAKTARELGKAENAMRKNIDVLENVKEKVPEQAKQAISLAISRSAKGQATVASVADENEKELEEETREQIANRMKEIGEEAKKMRNQARENLKQGTPPNQIVQNIEIGTAKELGKQAKKAAEENKVKTASRIAEGAGNRVRAAVEAVEDNTGLKKAMKANQKHIQVLENVREKVPDVAKPAISLAIKQSSKQIGILENIKENGIGPGKNIQKKIQNRMKKQIKKAAEEHERELENLQKQIKKHKEKSKTKSRT